METNIPFEKCLSYIDSQLQNKGKGASVVRQVQRGPAVTISRQTGSGAHEIAEKLAADLQEHETEATHPWTVFDRDLVVKVLEDHHLPKRLAQYIPEKRLSYVQDTLEELLGLRPSTWSLLHKMMGTILHLAQLGHAILVGRGANIITAGVPNVFHVRLVGSLDKRVAYVQKVRGLSAKEALQLIKEEDRGRAQYMKEHFHQDIADPLLYHLVLNTDRFSYDQAARLIGLAARNLFQHGASSSTSHPVSLPSSSRMKSP